MHLRRAYDPSPLSGAFGAALGLHVVAAAGLYAMRQPPAPALPPMYRVDLVAAPPGPRREGVVTPPTPAPRRPTAETPVPRAETRPREMPAARPATPRERPPPAPATPQPAVTERPQRAAPAPAAGGGPVGDRGTDVATVRTEGIEFPYQAYLDNIVRQIAKEFEAPTRAPLRAEVFFNVRRDGSVANLRLLVRSGNFTFDQAALGAVEAAGNARAFGPLPDGFEGDVLPVIFSFDPRVVR